MKSFVAVAMKVLRNIFYERLNMKFGLLIVSDESADNFCGTRYWVEEMGLNAKVILDPDGGRYIHAIAEKAKGILGIKLISDGKVAHGAKPWSGIDANENLVQAIANLRKYFPSYSKDNAPEDMWVNTMHVGIMKGGNIFNKIAFYAEATLDFRLIDTISKEDVLNILEDVLPPGVQFEVMLESKNVLIDRNNRCVQYYANCIRDVIQTDVVFNYEDGASDGRYFANKGMVVITHQATGGCCYETGEWVDIYSLYQLERIQMNFLRSDFMRELVGNS